MAKTGTLGHLAAINEYIKKKRVEMAALDKNQVGVKGTSPSTATTVVYAGRAAPLKLYQACYYKLVHSAVIAFTTNTINTTLRY